MMNEQLQNYIQESLKAGRTKDEIKKSLLESGWQESDIQEAFRILEVSEISTPVLEKRGNDEAFKAVKKTNFIEFLRNHFKRRQVYYALGAIILIVGAVVFYQKIILKEAISEFQLIPKTADAAGIVPNTSFALKSTADLSATVIQKYLEFDPKVDYKVSKISTGNYEITPAVALDENKVYSVLIPESPIAARTYSWAYQVKAPFQAIATLPRDKSNGVPTNTGIEITFNRENLISPEQSFEISPSVPGRFEVHRNVLVFVPMQKLLAKTVYAIKIKAGIKAQGSDDTLSQDTEIKFETGDEYTYQSRPSFSFDKTFWEFKPDSEETLEVNAYNLQSNTVPLVVYKFANLQEFINTYKGSVNGENRWTRYHAYNPVNLPADKKVFESNLPIQQQANINFIGIPQKLDEGYYLADVVVNGEHDQAWFQVTPLASFTAISGSKTLLWLKDLSSGNNISNADVSFDNNGLGKTNSDGVAMFDTPSQIIRSKDDINNYYYYSPLSYFYIVTAGSRQVAVPIENEYGYFSKVSPPNKWWDYLSTDKTIYLPTDKLHFWGIVRQRNGSDVKGEEVTIQLTNSFWEGTPQDQITVYGETKSTISDFYTLTGEISFSDLKPGYYQLTVRRGDEIIVSQGVDVETYVKPAYQLTLSADKNAVFAGDTITFKAKAEFFDGTPVANLKLKYNGYLNKQVDGDVQLNQDGEGSFTIKTDYQENQYSYWPRYLGMNISPAVSEEGEIDSNMSVLVFGPRIDLRTEQSIQDKTSKFDLHLRKIILDKIQKGQPWWDSNNYLGDPVISWNITAKVDEVIYNQTQTGTGYDIINKTTYPIYSYSTEYRPTRQDTLTTDGAGNAHYEWTPESKKTYRITFTAQDSDGRAVKREHWVYGGSYSYFGFYDASGVMLKNLDNKTDYNIGDAVHLEMQNYGGNALAPGSGKFVFIRINNGIVSYQIADGPDYSDIFKDSYTPNVNILGVWFTGSRFSDTYPISLSFNSDERRLNIEVNKDKDRYKPGDKVNLGIRVTDKNGNPKQAEVNVSGIDQAVFSLNPEEKDVTSDVYQNISVSLITRSSHFAPLEQGAEGGGCFAAGTQVLTPSGLAAIEKLKIGDEVLTREGDYSSGFVRAKIKKISSHLVNGYLLINNNLKITSNHRLFVNGTWKHAGETQIGDMLLDKDGREVKITSLKFIGEWGLVYNIELKTYHTYFADGIYVHNAEKGGGGARADFREIVIYKSVNTDSNGRANVSFDAPDNLTSWRITSQAITKDLFAGKNVSFVPVGLPFFVETTLNKTYLAGDNLVLRARVFGTANVGDNITYTIESDTLPFKKINKTGSKVVEIPVGNLTAGKHQIKISAQSSNYSDAIIRDLTVLNSYFTKSTSDFYELSPTLSDVKGAVKGYTTLTFSSYERGRFYPVLQSIACDCGVRIDQKGARWFAENYLNRFFSEKNEIEDFNAANYQTSDGGIALLPYSDKDLALSAKFANLSKDEITGADSESLKQYLTASLNDRKADLSRVVTALYGLAAFKEPVLITLQNIKTDKNLTLMDKIYVALTLDSIGAKEEARTYYESQIKSTLTTKQPFVFENKLNNQDDNIIATTLLAGLTADLHEQESDGLGQYAMENYPKETLKNFELLLYLKNVLPNLKGGKVSFAYHTSSKNETKTLENNETFQLQLSPEELATIKFSNISGRIGLVSSYDKESSPAEAKKDATLGVSRSYSVDGRQTNEFNDGDLIRIDIAPTFAPGALQGTYQVVDYLPSGLRAVTNLQRTPFNPNYSNYLYYPSDIEDQKVTFVVWKDYPRPFYYYARVVSKGNYKAEPVLIQSLKSSESSNISNENAINIK